MRNLARQRQSVWIGRYFELIAQKDDQGRLTGNHIPMYRELDEFHPTVSPVSGTASVDVPGTILDYTRTVIIDDPKFPASENDVLWIDAPVDTYRDKQLDNHDYIVRRVSRTGGYTLLLVKHVEASR